MIYVNILNLLILSLTFEAHTFPNLQSGNEIFTSSKFLRLKKQIATFKTTEFIFKTGNTTKLGGNFRSRTNIIELAKQLNLTTLVEKLAEAGMTDVLDHEGKFTLFAPTNEAFVRRPSYCDNVALKDLMKYHVARGAYLSDQLRSNELLSTMLTDREIRINMYADMKITANGRLIATFDHVASNGVIHVLEDVMCALYVGSVIVQINRCPSFHTFSSAVNLTRLFKTLDGIGPFTVFVPSDKAFNNLPPKMFHFLKTNLTAFAEVLVYHVVSDVWYSPGLTNRMQLRTLQGSLLTISVSDVIKVNNAVVTLPDATASNGVVHSIDAVLLPPSFGAKEELME